MTYADKLCCKSTSGKVGDCSASGSGSPCTSTADLRDYCLAKLKSNEVQAIVDIEPTLLAHWFDAGCPSGIAMVPQLHFGKVYFGLNIKSSLTNSTNHTITSQVLSAMNDAILTSHTDGIMDRIDQDWLQNKCPLAVDGDDAMDIPEMQDQPLP